MRFVRYGEKGLEKPGLLDAEGYIRDLADIQAELGGVEFGDNTLMYLNVADPGKLPLVPGKPRLGPCIANVGKVVGVAINYRMHTDETRMKQPSEPVLFLKATSAICGPDDDLVLPRGSQKTDWEVELGVVIGRRAQNVSVSQAMDYIAGYCVVDDVSERAFQSERGGLQHTKGKSADTFCPLGPWFVPRADIVDPQALRLWTKVNGQILQDGTTADMLFSVKQLVSYISEFMTLVPGDVIATGTPDGVGKGRKPPVYLRAGDVIELGVEGLGVQKHRVVDYGEKR